MAGNIKRSTRNRNTTAAGHRVISWNTELENEIEKLEQPALLQAFNIAVKCCQDRNWVDEFVNHARDNPHRLTEASFPLDMVEIYLEYGTFDPLEDCTKEDLNMNSYSSLEGYIAWLVISKLWAICESASKRVEQDFTPATVREITGICLLAEHAQFICNSQDHAINASRPLDLIDWKKEKKAKRLSAKFWKKAEHSLIERYTICRGLYPSLEAAAMSLSETREFPYNFIECFQFVLKHEGQI
jgi:hypothetical protein